VAYSISVIIRTKNESRYLGRVLQRLKEQQYEGPVEIILVDSGSIDNTVSIAAGFGCRIIEMKAGTFSFGRALNLGIKEAKGDIIINLSGHSVPVNTDYFNLMAQPFVDDKVAATFGRDIPWPEACPSQARDILNHFSEVGPDGNKFSNANAALRRQVWQAVPFDEQLSACEDVLWARSVMGKGYKITYVGKATVFHSHTSSLRYIFNRYLKERKSMKKLVNIPDIGMADVFRNALWQAVNDFAFLRRNGYHPKWYFHVPFYRLAQEAGLYLGSRSAD
jgi:glycosyltransferase involved in cell wall biosynthesis